MFDSLTIENDEVGEGPAGIDSDQESLVHACSPVADPEPYTSSSMTLRILWRVWASGDLVTAETATATAKFTRSDQTPPCKPSGWGVTTEVR